MQASLNQSWCKIVVFIGFNATLRKIKLRRRRSCRPANFHADNALEFHRACEDLCWLQSQIGPRDQTQASQLEGTMFSHTFPKIRIVKLARLAKLPELRAGMSDARGDRIHLFPHFGGKIATLWEAGKTSGVCLVALCIVTTLCPENNCMYRKSHHLNPFEVY